MLVFSRVNCSCLFENRIQQLAEEFYTYVGELKQVAEVMDVDMDTLDIIYNYWVLKRKVP